MWKGRKGGGWLEILCRSLASAAADLNDVRRVVPARFEVITALLITVIYCWGRALSRLVEASGELAASIIRVTAFSGA